MRYKRLISILYLSSLCISAAVDAADMGGLDTMPITNQMANGMNMSGMDMSSISMGGLDTMPITNQMANGMNMSGMDMSSISMGSMDMPGMDMSAMNNDALTGMNAAEESLKQTMNNTTQSFAERFTGLGATMKLDDINLSDFSSSLINNPGLDKTSFNNLAEELSGGVNASSLADAMSGADAYFEQTMGVKFSGIDENLFSVKMPENISFESLNTQFAGLQASFAIDTKDLKTEIARPDTEFSGSAKASFQSKYGSLADDLKLSSFKVPDSFDTSAMMKTAIAEKSSAYEQFKSNEAFKTIENKVGIGSTFGQVAKQVSDGPKKYALDSQAAIRKEVNEKYAGEINSGLKDADAANKASYQKVENKVLSDLSTAANKAAAATADDKYSMQLDISKAKNMNPNTLPETGN